MSYFDVRDALQRAAEKQGGGFVSVKAVQAEIPTESASSIAVELGAMHDHGEATVIGSGLARIARFDQAIHPRPSAADSALARAEIRARLERS